MSQSARQAGVSDAPVLHYRDSAREDVLPFVPPLPSGARALEVGCGEGHFLGLIPELAERWGIEPHVPSAASARLRLDHVLPGLFDDVRHQLPRGYFDLVVCNDVIEHMSDHDAFLRAVQDHMAPGAYLVGSVPNVRYYRNLFNAVIAKDWHYQAAGVLDRTHLRFFTQRSLRRSLEDTGYSVVRLDGLNRGPRLAMNRREIAERLFRAGLAALAGGASSDVMYIQIGFLASRPVQ